MTVHTLPVIHENVRFPYTAWRNPYAGNAAILWLVPGQIVVFPLLCQRPQPFSKQNTISRMFITPVA